MPEATWTRPSRGGGGGSRARGEQGEGGALSGGPGGRDPAVGPEGLSCAAGQRHISESSLSAFFPAPE